VRTLVFGLKHLSPVSKGLGLETRCEGHGLDLKTRRDLELESFSKILITRLIIAALAALRGDIFE